MDCENLLRLDCLDEGQQLVEVAVVAEREGRHAVVVFAGDSPSSQHSILASIQFVVVAHLRNKMHWQHAYVRAVLDEIKLHAKFFVNVRKMRNVFAHARNDVMHVQQLDRFLGLANRVAAKIYCVLLSVVVDKGNDLVAHCVDMRKLVGRMTVRRLGYEDVRMLYVDRLAAEAGPKLEVAGVQNGSAVRLDENHRAAQDMTAADQLGAEIIELLPLAVLHLVSVELWIAKLGQLVSFRAAVRIADDLLRHVVGMGVGGEGNEVSDARVEQNVFLVAELDSYAIAHRELDVHETFLFWRIKMHLCYEKATFENKYKSFQAYFNLMVIARVYVDKSLESRLAVDLLRKSGVETFPIDVSKLPLKEDSIRFAAMAYQSRTVENNGKLPILETSYGLFGGLEGVTRFVKYFVLTGMSR